MSHPLRLTVLLWLILLPPTPGLAATAFIQISADAKNLPLGDVLVVDIETTGLLDPVDIAPLLENFQLRRETRGTRIAVIEGKVADVTSRHMELLARRLGHATLGPLRGESAAGVVVSNALQVQITPAVNEQWIPSPADSRVSMNLSPAEQVLGGQSRLDIVLQHRHPVADDEITLPNLAGLDAIPLFEARRTLADSDDERPEDWRLISWRYLLHPQRSGELEIEGVRWRGTLVRSRSLRANFDHQAPPIRWTVQAPPENWTDVGANEGADVGAGRTALAEWLPATAVQLSERWSRPPVELAAGDELERTLILVVDGALSHQLPAIELPVTRGLSITPLGTQRSQQVLENSTRATAEYRFRITAQSPVPVFLDTVRVPWWDTGSGQLQEAIIPARRINVGLPDNPLALAELARRDLGLGRIWQSAAWLGERQRWLVLASAVMFAISSLLVAGPHIHRRWHHWRARRRYRAWQRQLRSLIEDRQWEALLARLPAARSQGSAQNRLRSLAHRALHAPPGSQLIDPIEAYALVADLPQPLPPDPLLAAGHLPVL